MKRFFLILICFLVVFFVGCNREEKIELTASNFNHHFVVNYEIEQIENLAKFIIKIEPRFTLDIVEFDAKISFNFTYEELINDKVESVSHFRNLNFKVNDNGEMKNESGFSINSKSRNFQLASYNIMEIEGVIKGRLEPQYISKGFVTNKLKNRLAYVEMNNELSKFDNMAISNHVTINTDLSSRLIYQKNKGDYVSEYSQVKLRLDPYYTEVENSLEKTVIKEEMGTLYNYSIDRRLNGLDYVTKTIVKDNNTIPDEFGLNDILDYSQVDVNFIFDHSKIKVTIKEDCYELTGYYRHLLSKEQYDDFLNQMKALGLPKEVFDDAIFKIIIYMNDDEIKYDITLDIFPPNNKTYYVLTTKCTMVISFNEFSEINFNDTREYYFPVSKSFENANEINNLSNVVISYENPNPHYYFTNLDSGQYVFEKLYSEDFDVKIFDEDQNAIEDVFIYNGLHDNKFTFIIPENGKYYIEVKNNGINKISEYRFKITRMNYKDYFNLSNPMEVTGKNFSFTIDGEYDIIPIKIYSDKKGIIEFISTKDDYVNFYAYFDGKLILNNIPKASKTFALSEGNNIFYIMGNENDYNYSVNIQEVNNCNDVNNPFNVVISEWSEWIEISPDMSSIFFNFEVPHGVARLEYEIIGDDGKYIEVNISGDINITKSGSQPFNNCIFEEGKYSVKLKSMSRKLFRVRVVLDELSDYIEEYRLYKVKSQTPPNFRTVSGQYYKTKDFKYGKSFTLLENATVCINIYSFDYILYDSEYNRINFNLLNPNGVTDIYNLDAGTYYVIIIVPELSIGYYQLEFYSISIGIWDIDIEDRHQYGSNYYELVFSQNTISFDYANDVDVFKFILHRQENIRFTYVSGNYFELFVFGEDFENHLYHFEDPRYQTFSLEKGVYYFVFINREYLYNINYEIVFYVFKQ